MVVVTTVGALISLNFDDPTQIAGFKSDSKNNVFISFSEIVLGGLPDGITHC
jgi:hypothetical protein